MPSAPGSSVPSRVQFLPLFALRFTHDKIRPLFRSGEHCGLSLYTLVNNLVLDEAHTLESLPALEVVWHDGLYCCLSNRRLWCLRAYAGLCARFDMHVRVNVLDFIPNNFAEKNTTTNQGLSVLIDGDEERLREKFKNSRRTCRHFFSSRGCAKGSACSFSHDEKLPETRGNDLSPAAKLEQMAAEGQRVEARAGWGTQISEVAEADDAAMAEMTVKKWPPCKNDDACVMVGCKFDHPNGRRIDATKTEGQQKWPPCRDDDNCVNQGCEFEHPNGRRIDAKKVEGRQKLPPCRDDFECKNKVAEADDAVKAEMKELSLFVKDHPHFMRVLQNPKKCLADPMVKSMLVSEVLQYPAVRAFFERKGLSVAETDHLF